MSPFENKEVLRVLSKIIQLFSLTKNLNRDQWNTVEKSFWQVIAKDISLLLPKNPLVQIWQINRNQNVSNLLCSSSEIIKNHSQIKERAFLAQRGSIFEIDRDSFLYIELLFDYFGEADKTFLQTVVEHLRISKEWRETLERGFSVQNRINLLNKITSSIRKSLDLSEVLAKTARDLGESLEVSRCFIRRYDPNVPGKVLATEQEYTQKGFSKAADIIFDFETDWMKELAQKNSQTKKINEDFEQVLFEHSNQKEENDFLYLKQVSDEVEDSDGLVKNLAQAIDLTTFLGVPLVYNGITLGCICFHQCEQERDFEKDELDFIKQVSDEATVAVVHAQMYSHIQEQAMTDSLTSLHNKASFHKNFDQEIERTKRTNSDLSVIMIDLDFLKRANDTYGHIAGDEMIKLLGKTLKKSLRQIDIIARFGGDEFGAILPDTALEGAKKLTTRLTEFILETKHPSVGNLSASLGVAGTPFSPLKKDVLIKQADQALYLAKKRGKSKCCFSDDPELIKPKEEQIKSNNI